MCLNVTLSDTNASSILSKTFEKILNQNKNNNLDIIIDQN